MTDLNNTNNIYFIMISKTYKIFKYVYTKKYEKSLSKMFPNAVNVLKINSKK